MRMAGFILILIAAFFFPGIILRAKSIASGRKGPGILQPFKDIVVLTKKGSIFSRTTGLVFQIAPVITLSSIICAMLTIPFANNDAVISFDGDFIFFSYLLALGKFFAIIAALDTGSSFEGMGANREAFFSMLVEPAFFILLATFAMFTGHTSFSDIFSHFFITGNNYVLIYSIIGFYLLIQIAMIENSRLPVDDPKPCHGKGSQHDHHRCIRKQQGHQEKDSGEQAGRQDPSRHALAVHDKDKATEYECGSPVGLQYDQTHGQTNQQHHHGH